MAVIIRSAATISGVGLPDGGLTQLWWSPGTVGGSNADATDVLARFRTLWSTLAPRVTSGLTITFDPVCIALEATTGVLTGSFTGTTPAAVTGSASGDPLPRQTQGLIKFGTATVIGGRRVRGRLFVPGPVEADNTASGLPLAAYSSDLTSAGGSLFTPGATASDAVIWHRPTGGAGGASPDITSSAAALVWSVLRSRRS